MTQLGSQSTRLDQEIQPVDPPNPPIVHTRTSDHRRTLALANPQIEVVVLERLLAHFEHLAFHRFEHHKLQELVLAAENPHHVSNVVPFR
jgi:hypothetical protein